MRKILTAALTVLFLFTSSLGYADPIKDSLDKGVKFLARNQNPDGGYGPFGSESRVKNVSDVGITAFIVYTCAIHPRKYTVVDGPFMSKAVAYLLAHQQPDGGFYHPKDPVLKNYRTSVALMALVKLDRVAYSEPIRRARAFIVTQQRSERTNFSRDEHLSFGAVGQSGSLRGDLSNAAYAAEAMREAGFSASEPFWKKLELFVSRCQNSPKGDALLGKSGIGSTKDWGFRYAPNDTRGPSESLDDGSTAYSSYGSMTYQGLKSLLYANIDKKDPRVQGAFKWISDNFSLLENPGMRTPADPKAGLQGLYYYYHTMAKTLSVYGEPILVDSKGVKHSWAAELSEHLMKLQGPDGHWQNTSGRWWENLPTLDTAYAMIALSLCRDDLARQAASKAGAEK